MIPLVPDPVPYFTQCQCHLLSEASYLSAEAMLGYHLPHV